MLIVETFYPCNIAEKRETGDESGYKDA